VVNTLSGTYYYAAFAESNPPPPPTGHFTMTKGVYTGTGAVKSVTGLGFKPELVIVKNIVTGYAVFRTSAMTGDRTAYFTNNAVDLTGGVTNLDTDGFSLGINAAVNTSAGTYYWEAFDIPDAGATDFQVGSYVGNGQDNRSIAGLGFKPDMVMAKISNGGQHAVWKTSNQTGYVSSYFHNTAEYDNLIQSLESDGFQIGTDSNNVGYVYWWLAFKTGPNFSVGSYTGDGLDDKAISGIGFQPNYVWVKGNISQNGIHRSSSMPDNESQYFAATADLTTGIKSMATDGFTVGTHATVNTASTVYRYAAWKATADISAGTVSSLAQYQSDGVTAISTGGALTNPSSVFKFSMAHSDATATLTPQIEIKSTGTDFDGLNLLTGSAVDYSGTPVTGSVTSSSVAYNTNYHWRARMKDQNGNYSPWVSFGGNTEADTDFAGLTATIISSNTTWTTDQTFTNLQITNNAVVTVDSINKVGGAGQIVVTVTGDLTIDAGASIDSNSKGYAKGTGPGVGTSNYGGAGYGGVGGSVGGGYGGAGGGGPIYGSMTSPTDLGSGGWSASYGGAGGGAVKLAVTGTTTIDGSITANGGNGSGGSNNTLIGGGGSGGSIWINTNILAGNGSLSANGGIAGSWAGWYAGGGGGGRIALQYTTKTFVDSSVSVAVSPGSGKTSGNIGTITRNGQIFSCDSGTLNDTCVVYATRTMASGDTVSGSGNLIIANGGNVVSANGALFSITMAGDITIQSGGVINGSAVLSAANITVDNGGLINLNIKGYDSNNGPGIGDISKDGGGHGGLGGSINDASGGPAYGHIDTPTDSGSGGIKYDGNIVGGIGGGAVKLTATGVTTINGSITANGGSGSGGNNSSQLSGGGAGGSVWISTGTFDGSGSITTNGGAGGSYSSYLGGGGGGGRIAIEYVTSTYSGTKTAYGGGTGGGAGTIYLKSAAQTYGELYINNNAQTTGVTPLPVTGGNGGEAATWQFDNELDGITNGGYLQIPSGATLRIISTAPTISGTGGIINVSSGGTLSAPNMTSSATIAGTLTLDTGSTFNMASLASLTVSGTLNIGNTQALDALTSINHTGTININSGGTLSLNSLTSWAIGGALALNTGGTLSLPVLPMLTIPASKTLTLNSGATFTAESLDTIIVNGTVYLNGVYSFPAVTMTINSGGVLTHGANTTDKVNYIDLTLASLDVQAGGKIDVNAKGYSGNSAGPSAACSACGAGYGGAGGTDVGIIGAGGEAYGSATAPIDLGSSGNGTSGGVGGGAVKIIVSGTTTISGAVTSNGGNGPNYYNAGGSGGSIWINTGTLAGNGSISANGGNGAVNYSAYGGGGGGRIALQYTTKTYIGSVAVNGGGPGGIMGTIKKNGQSFICDSGTLDDTCTVSSLQIMDDGETISGSGNLILASGANIAASFGKRFSINMAGDVTVQSGGAIAGSATITAANLAVNSGGSISAVAVGNRSLSGVGAAGSYGGGGYGGVGGGASGGSTYGSLSVPSDLGSGGGRGYYNDPGGTGGGAIKIIVTGTTTVGGSISANGGNGGYVRQQAGGGSGGSVWINTGTLAGNGSILANGGVGNGCNYSICGSGGGGGRIALYYSNKTYNGSIAVAGGVANGGVAGFAGTIYDIASVITNPADGSRKNGNPTISGTAVSALTISLVEALVKDNVTDTCWDGSIWTVCPTDSADWPDATGTATWSYTGLATENYIDGHSYTVRSRATDSAYMEVPTIGKTFTYDTTGPSVVLSFNLSRPTRDADTLRVTATFSEAVLDSPIPQISISYAGGGTLSATDMTKTDTTHYYYDVDVPAGSDGVATATINAQDLAGNLIDNSSSPVDFNIEGNYVQQDEINGTDFESGVVKLHDGANNISATGGTITYTDSNGLNPRTSPAYVGGYTVHTFTTSGTFNATGSGNVTVLVVGGGGGGNGGVSGVNYGDGGGGGTVVYNASYAVTAGNKTVTVGNGGAGVISGTPETGQSSVFDAIIATGGTGTINTSRTGGANANYIGGTGSVSSSGGGGAGGGGNGSTKNGGIGYASAISGVSTGYAGGGSSSDSNSAGTAVDGGGAYSGGTPHDGTVNTGGGGSGADSNHLGGNGGSGIVIVRYLSDLLISYPTSQSYYVTTAAASQLNTSNWTHISGVVLTQTTPTNTSIKYLVSFDNRNTWKYFDGSIWQETTLDNTNLQLQGMEKDYLEAITQNQWEASGGFVPGGTAILDFAADLNSTDSAVTPSIDNIRVNHSSNPFTFTVDNTNPEVALTYDLNRPVKDSDTLRVTATFDEEVRDDPVPQIAVSYTGGGTLAATNMTKTDTTHYYYDVDVPSGSDGSASITISNAQDLAGNSNNAATNNTFTVDNTGADVTLSYDLNRPVKDSDTLRVTATFDEVIADSPIPQIAVSYTGGGTLSATNMTKTDTTHYYYDVDVPAGSDGAANITISNAQDLTSNSNNAATNNTFTVDNTKPLLTSLTLSDPSPTKAGDLTLTLNFNEPMDTGTNPTITLGTSSPFEQHIVSTNKTWVDNTTFTVQVNIPDDQTWDGTNTIKVSGAKDLAANTMDDNTTNTFVIDTTKATLSSITLSDPTPTKAGTVDFTLNFNEPMDTNTDPTVTFGTALPYNQHAVNLNGTWTDSDTFFVQVNIPDNQTWDGTNTIKVSDAKDLSNNIIASNIDNTFIIDTTKPISTITTPDATNNAGHGYSVMPTISGTSSDNNVLNSIYVSIKDTTDGTHFWSGTDWSITEENNSWLPATTGTTNWSYDAATAHVTWTVNSDYLIKSKATDTAGNTETPAVGNTFTFINSHPTVSNVTATQKNDDESNGGQVEVSYDVTDLESSQTTVSLFYDSSATLATAIPDNSSTATIQTTDGTRFSTAGTIMLKKGTGETAQYEYISYTGKSGNNLTGIARSQEGTVGTDHPSGEQIWIKATSLTNNYGSQTNGTGKTILWDAKADTNFYDATIAIRVAANDNASSNNIGILDSATFELDTKKPAVTSANLDARDAVPNDSGHPATLNLNVSDDTQKQMLLSLNADFSGATWTAYNNTPTITLATNPDTVYLKFKDAKGNTTDDQVLTTPNTPGSVMIQDISSAAQDKWRLYVSWQIISTPAPGFDAYQVYRSATQNGTYSYLGATVADNINADYYSDTVNFDDTYYYKVTSKDDNGNYSFYSNYMHGTANAILDAGEGGGGSGGDVTPPQILTGPTATPTNNAASITWTTDEIADSYIEYGETISYGSVFGLSATGTDHSVTLPETLSGSTPYHYRVRTRDIAGNLFLSGDFNFTTTAGGDITSPTISAVNSTSITSTSATITFTTNENSSSYIDYGTTQNVYTKTTGNSADATMSHTVNLTSLTPNTTYYYRVRSVDGSGNEATDANSGNYSFQTLNSPTITNPTAINITDTEATITYTTSSNAYGFVDYGTTNSYGQVRGDDANVHTAQSIQLSNLTPGTTYHYRPRIKDIYGNYTFDATDYTFETISSDAPVLQSLTSTTDDGIYGPASSINLTATYNQTLATNSSITVTLNTGAQIILNTISNDTKLIGTYTIGATGSNQNTSALSVSTIALQNVCNANSNCLTGTTLPGENINTNSTIIVDTTAPVFSSIAPDNAGNIASLTTSSDLSYTTSENLNTGSITITRTSGATDSSSPHVCTLLTTALNQGAHANFDMTNCQEGAPTLVTGAIYTISFNGTDIATNTAETIEKTAITYGLDSTPPQILTGPTATPTNNSATITWTTDEPADSYVEYGLDTSYGAVFGNSALGTTHSVTLPATLSGSTLYHYRIKTKDASNNLTTS
ncbi:MAG: fibronectin type III domain-containing protein, partial [Candidatus Moraniibacteriota bacterium]